MGVVSPPNLSLSESFVNRLSEIRFIWLFTDDAFLKGEALCTGSLSIQLVPIEPPPHPICI